MFEARGVYHGRRVAVAWDDGRLTGDSLAAQAVALEAQVLDGHAVGPEGGPYTSRDHLADPLSAYLLVLRVFDRLDALAGDPPRIPDVPSGAIA